LEENFHGGSPNAQRSLALSLIIERYNFEIDLDAVTSELSVAAQQKVEIVKQLYRRVDTLILDEPTSVLTPQETRQLFEEIGET
jgi:ABC-type uncharacterized transport systems, ATPase components